MEDNALFNDKIWTDNTEHYLKYFYDQNTTKTTLSIHILKVFLAQYNGNN